MKVTKKGTVYQLTFFPSWFPVNCYLVDEGNALTLVDAALPFSYKGILKTATSIGKPITRIILTHAHSDHIGALDRLKELLPDCEVVISARDAKLLRGDVTLEAGELKTPVRGGVPKPGKIKAVPDREVSEGDLVGSFRVIAAPGHTPGHIALYNEQMGVLLAGDAFQVRGGMAVSGQLRPFFPFPAWATWNKDAAIQTAIKLENLSPTLLGVGHGHFLTDPKAAMVQAIRQAQGAAEAVRE